MYISKPRRRRRIDGEEVSTKNLYSTIAAFPPTFFLSFPMLKKRTQAAHTQMGRKLKEEEQSVNDNLIHGHSSHSCNPPLANQLKTYKSSEISAA